jgi:Mn2+/Fe2+ NRAMP family transporter
MRLIAPDPEFTWTGTIFIVAAFTFFGLAQSVVAVTRKRLSRRWKVTIVRTFGAMAMLPLFVAAGAVMLPTVAGCGLAVARTGWPTITRSACLVVAAGPVLFVGRDLVDSFGWSLHTLAGFVVMLAIYAVIIWATRFTFTAQPDGWRLTRRARVVVPLVIVVLVLILFVAGGGFQ